MLSGFIIMVVIIAPTYDKVPLRTYDYQKLCDAETINTRVYGLNQHTQYTIQTFN